MGWFFIVAVMVSLIIGFYLGFRLLSLFNCQHGGYFTGCLKKAFWALILFSSLTFMMSRVLSAVSNYWFPLIGNLIFALVLCLFYAMIIIDIIRIISYYLGGKIYRHSRFLLLLQVGYFILAAMMFIVGLYLASSSRIITYDININKSAQFNELKIVQVADIHISETTSPTYIKSLVDQINQLKPDYVFITGDTLDLRLQPYLDKDLDLIFAQLQSRFGTFIILGNHEYYGIEREENNSLEEVVAAFEAGNMRVLRDKVFYDDKTGIYLIGREDYVVHQFNQQRAELSSLTSAIDPVKPIILLDHQPQDLIEPQRLGVDVMFSGHTHAGQIFPMTLLVDLIYTNPWGIYQPSEQFSSIVTSGYGLWGPSIRLMTRAEIVVTNIHFNNSELNDTLSGTQ